MKTATVRDLRNSFPTVAKWIEAGELVEITRAGKPFAHLAPAPSASTRKVRMPDFLARMRELFPSEFPAPETGSILDYDRGAR